MEHEQPHESSNHFCFGRDEIGHLTERCVMDRLEVMTRNEQELYSYRSFFTRRNRYRSSQELIVDPDWRASIVKWSYSVVDYFHLSREVVALSISIFDRFFATGICRPSSEMILLASIATLHIAIKLRESAIIRLSTLSWFGRGRFRESQIADMELRILMILRWCVNPPTTIAFVMHLLLLLPEISSNFRREILESSRFLSELAVADSFFITKRPSVVGMAAILNSLDECEIKMHQADAENYLNSISNAIAISHNDAEIMAVRQRLRLLAAVNGG
mmetsp:Transcript_19550/g.33598  ORF Transcript_19550/g.33598 Transcript_19550/m.33598 type:complete len:275 (+) Transcript_19550:96-920(+)